MYPLMLEDWRDADYIIWVGNELQFRRAARVIDQLLDGPCEGAGILWIVRRIASESPRKAGISKNVIHSHYPRASIVEAVEPYVFFDLGLMEQRFYGRAFERWVIGLRKPQAILIPAARNKFAQIAQVFEKVHGGEVFLVEDGLGNIREIETYARESQTISRTEQARHLIGKAWDLWRQLMKGGPIERAIGTQLIACCTLLCLGLSSLLGNRHATKAEPTVFREFSRVFVRNPEDWFQLLPRNRVFQLGGLQGSDPAGKPYKQRVEGALVDVEAVFLLPAGDFPPEMWEGLISRALEVYKGKIFYKPHPNHQSYEGFYSVIRDKQERRLIQLDFAGEFEIFTGKFTLECLIGMTSTAMTFHRTKAPHTRIESISEALMEFLEHPNAEFRKLAKQELSQNKLWATSQRPPPNLT